MVLRYQSFRVILGAGPAYRGRGQELRLRIGHLRDERSQWCNRLLTVVAGFVLDRRERRWLAKVIATEESEGEGAGRLFVARGRGTHKAPSPRKLTSYPTIGSMPNWVALSKGGREDEAYPHDACVSGSPSSGPVDERSFGVCRSRSGGLP